MKNIFIYRDQSVEAVDYGKRIASGISVSLLLVQMPKPDVLKGKLCGCCTTRHISASCRGKVTMRLSRCLQSTIQHQMSDLESDGVISDISRQCLMFFEALRCFSRRSAFAARGCTQYQTSNIQSETITTSSVN